MDYTEKETAEKIAIALGKACAETYLVGHCEPIEYGCDPIGYDVAPKRDIDYIDALNELFPDEINFFGFYNRGFKEVISEYPHTAY